MIRSQRMSEVCVRALFTIALFVCCTFAHAAATLTKFSVATSRTTATKNAVASKAAIASSQASTTTLVPMFTDGFDGLWAVPAGRKISGLVSYPTLGVSPYPNHTVSLADFQPVLGDGDPRTPETLPFPGGSTSLCINGVLPGEYIALAFTPHDAKAFTEIRAATYGNEVSASLTAAVSRNAGDFAGAIVGVRPGNALKKIVVAPYTNGTQALPGEVTYFNVKHAGTRAHMICLTNSPGRQP